MRRPLAPAAAAVLVQLALGLAAHVAVDGCLPAAPVLVAMLPAAGLAVWLPQRLLRRAGRATRLAAGQALFHAAMVLVVPCTGHGNAPAYAPVEGMAALAGTAAMPAAHVVVVVVCLLILDRVERSATTAASRLREALVRLKARFTKPHLMPVAARSRLVASPVTARTPLLWMAGTLGMRGPPAGVG